MWCNEKLVLKRNGSSAKMLFAICNNLMSKKMYSEVGYQQFCFPCLGLSGIMHAPTCVLPKLWYSGEFMQKASVIFIKKLWNKENILQTKRAKWLEIYRKNLQQTWNGFSLYSKQGKRIYSFVSDYDSPKRFFGYCQITSVHCIAFARICRFIA